ncbi:hypothetical protein Gasu2_37130 [Galdieria sulphuraria]|nr:hypothetical protein Gasu2_37130 [Galdieria sulphuraria]
MECQIQKCLLPCLWILYSCLKTVASFEFHQVNTIPRFETTESFSCAGDSLTLLRSTNHVQQRDIWYELSLGTYPSAWICGYHNTIHTVTPDAIFLAGAVLHDIQWNNKVDDLQGWSFQSIQWNHQQPFDISIAETVSENHMLSFTLFTCHRVYNKQPNSVDQVCLKFFVFGCAEQFLWDDPTTYDFPYVSMRNNYHSFEEARTSSHPHPYIACPEESQQIDSWKLGDEYTVGVLTFSIDVSRIEWKRLSFGLSIGYATVPPFVDRWTRKFILSKRLADLKDTELVLYYCHFERRKYTEDAVWSAEKLHSHHSCLPISEETVPLLYRNNTFTILNSMKTT